MYSEEQHFVNSRHKLLATRQQFCGDISTLFKSHRQEKTASSLNPFAFNPLFNTGFLYLIYRASRKSRRLELVCLKVGRILVLIWMRLLKECGVSGFVCVTVIYVIKVIKDVVQIKDKISMFITSFPDKCLEIELFRGSECSDNRVAKFLSVLPICELLQVTCNQDK